MNFFKKLYPFQDLSLKNGLTYCYVGIFVSLFLIIFKPFGIDYWITENKILKLIGFGAVTILTGIVLKVIVVNVITAKQKDNWKVYQEIISIIVMLICIAICNLLYLNILHVSSFSFSHLLSSVFYTCLIGIFPVILSVLYKYNHFLKLNTKEAQLIENEIQINLEQKTKVAFIPLFEDNLNIPKSPEKDEEPQAVIIDKLTLKSDNEKDCLEITADNLLYIESMDNYCSIVFNENDKKKKVLLRSSLKRMEQFISVTYIIKCHRAYLVNLKQVIHIEGNAQGYRLTLNNVEETIPVSRNFGKTILEQVKMLK